MEIDVEGKPMRFALSAHADSAALLARVLSVRPGHTLLVHGSDEARELLGKHIKAEGLSCSSDHEFELRPTT